MPEIDVFLSFNTYVKHEHIRSLSYWLHTCSLFIFSLFTLYSLCITANYSPLPHILTGYWFTPLNLLYSMPIPANFSLIFRFSLRNTHYLRLTSNCIEHLIFHLSLLIPQFTFHPSLLSPAHLTNRFSLVTAHSSQINSNCSTKLVAHFLLLISDSSSLFSSLRTTYFSLPVSDIFALLKT